MLLIVSENNNIKVLFIYSFPQRSHLKNWQLSHFFVLERNQLDGNLSFLHLVLSDTSNLVLIPTPVLQKAELKLY